MIHLVARCVRADQRERVAAWLRDVDGPRRVEPLESLPAVGIDHETVQRIDTTDGPILVAGMQSDDIEHARTVADRSTRMVDIEHRDVMRSADDGPADAELILDLRPDGTATGRAARTPRGDARDAEHRHAPGLARVRAFPNDARAAGAVAHDATSESSAES